MKCGIVGLPNVGKSTLYNALTRAQIPAANFPFCTIDPHVGVVPVPDQRLETLADIAESKETIATVMEFVDIAGLVEGASKGEGLGNKFLANIRETDAIVHVVRCFEDADVVHVAGRVDPVADIEIIDTELALADLEAAQRALNKAERDAKSQEKDAIAHQKVLQKVYAHLSDGQPLRSLELDTNEGLRIRPYNFLTLKPVLFVTNVDENGVSGNDKVAAVESHAADQRAEVVVICGAIESEIAMLDEADKQEFLADLGLSEPGLNRVIRAGYQLLNLQTFFTAGPKEARAWTVYKGATAPQAAGRIHTDFEKGFIRAEVISYDDYVALGGEAGARDAGKLRLEGKDYIVREGDVIHFRFNV